MRKIILVFSTLFAILSATVITASAAPSIKTATYMPANKKVVCKVNNGEHDYYYFYPSVSGVHALRCLDKYGDHVEFLDSKGKVIASADSAYGKVSLKAKLTAGKKYYIDVATNAWEYTKDAVVILDAPVPKTRKDISKAKVSLSTTKYTYNGLAKEPTATVTLNGVKLVKYKDFYIKYSSNVNAGTAKATVVGIGKYKGSVTKSFTIAKKVLKSCTVNSVYYTGEDVTPKPSYYKVYKVYSEKEDAFVSEKKLTNYVKDKDYTITFKGDRKNIGERTVVFTFKGNYSGKVTAKYNIIPKKVTGLKADCYSTTSVKVTWKKVSECTGYLIYRYDLQKNEWVYYKTLAKNTLSCVVPENNAADDFVRVMVRTYKTVDGKRFYSKKSDSPNAYNITIPVSPEYKVTRLSKTMFKVIFNEAGNYEIQISDNIEFKNDDGNYLKTLKTIDNNEITVSLNADKEYFIRTRVYTSGYHCEPVFSSWSDVNSVNTFYRFRNEKLLNEHYEKHGREMGFSSAAEYETAAAKVIYNPNAQTKTEKEDGDGVYYIESTGEFVILSTDGYIRTYYIADKDYFLRQQRVMFFIFGIRNFSSFFNVLR